MKAIQRHQNVETISGARGYVVDQKNTRKKGRLYLVSFKETIHPFHFKIWFKECDLKPVPMQSLWEQLKWTIKRIFNK